MRRRHLRGRLLSGLLAVTLVFSDLSLSAFAMENSASVQMQEESLEETSDESSLEDDLAEGKAEESSAQESSVEGSSVEESSVEGSSVEETSVEGSSVEESNVEGSSVEESSVEESSTDNAQENIVAEIVFSKDDDNKILKEYKYTYNEDANPAKELENLLRSRSYVRVEGRIDPGLGHQLIYTWKIKGADNTYTGSPIQAPAVDGENPEISYKVVVVDGGNDVKTLEVAFDELETGWIDLEGNKIDGAPVDAGTYIYTLKYTDESGIYAESEA